MREPRFRIQVDKDGCEHCEAGRLWVVVDTVTDCATGRSFADEEAADDLARDMNYAYELNDNTPEKIEELLRIYHATHLVIQQSGEGFRIDAHFTNRQTVGFAEVNVSTAVSSLYADVDIPF